MWFEGDFISTSVFHRLRLWAGEEKGKNIILDEIIGSVSGEHQYSPLPIYSKVGKQVDLEAPESFNYAGVLDSWPQATSLMSVPWTAWEPWSGF